MLATFVSCLVNGTVNEKHAFTELVDKVVDKMVDKKTGLLEAGTQTWYAGFRILSGEI
jgi:hypothetical protein